jgi:hypothetical protein
MRAPQRPQLAPRGAAVNPFFLLSWALQKKQSPRQQKKGAPVTRLAKGQAARQALLTTAPRGAAQRSLGRAHGASRPST